MSENIVRVPFTSWGIGCFRHIVYLSRCQKWPNMLILFQLSYSLLFSNGRVEQMFSSLKALKTDEELH